MDTSTYSRPAPCSARRRRPPLRLVAPPAPAPASPTGSGRQEIRLDPGELHEYSARAEALLSDAVYVQGQTRLVRIVCARDAEGRTDVVRDDDQPMLMQAGVEYLRHLMSQRAEFSRPGKNDDWRPVDPPIALAKHIAERGEWRHFRPLDGIATGPFLRDNLTICAAPGYDPSSQVYVVCADSPAITIPATPTKDDSRVALERLLAPFAEFPFAAPAAKSAFAAHVLTAAARHAIDTRPIFLYSAPAAGTGKSLLSAMPALIAEGFAPAVRQWVDDADELRKVLLTSLLAGDSQVVLDNVGSGSKVRSATLCAFATAINYTDRVLGSNSAPRLRNQCGLILTGNNITPAGDLAGGRS